MIRALKIFPADEEILKAPCVPVDTDTEDYTELFLDLLETAVSHSPKCIGLAANQIGVSRRALVMQWGDKFIPLINPEVVGASDKMVSLEESCMSFPTRAPRPTRRHKTIKVKFFDPLLGEERTQKFKGRDAIVLQHELNHLDGVLI